jgi:hypothetical protein
MIFISLLARNRAGRIVEVDSVRKSAFTAAGEVAILHYLAGVYFGTNAVGLLASPLYQRNTPERKDAATCRASPLRPSALAALNPGSEAIGKRTYAPSTSQPSTISDGDHRALAVTGGGSSARIAGVPAGWAKLCIAYTVIEAEV